MGVAAGGFVAVISGINPSVGNIVVAVGEDATGRLTGQHIHASVRQTEAIKIPFIGFFMITYRKFNFLSTPIIAVISQPSASKVFTKSAAALTTRGQTFVNTPDSLALAYSSGEPIS